MSNVVQLPPSERERMKRLYAVAAKLDTAAMTTEQVVAAFRAELPDAAPNEIIAALRGAAMEHERKADQLDALKPGAA